MHVCGPNVIPMAIQLNLGIPRCVGKQENFPVFSLESWFPVFGARRLDNRFTFNLVGILVGTVIQTPLFGGFRYSNLDIWRFFKV